MPINDQSEWQDNFDEYRSRVTSEIYGGYRRADALFDLLEYSPEPIITVTELVERLNDGYTHSQLYSDKVLETLGKFGFVFRVPKINHPTNQFVALVNDCLNWLRTGGPNVKPTKPCVVNMIDHVGHHLRESIEIQPAETVLVGWALQSVSITEPEIELDLRPTRDDRTGKRGYLADIVIEYKDIVMEDEKALLWDIWYEMHKMTRLALHRTDVNPSTLANNVGINDWTVDEQAKRIGMAYELDPVVKV